MTHYFTNEGGDKRTYERTLDFGEREFVFTTSDGVFSKKDVDAGTHWLLQAAVPLIHDRPVTVVDLGCGYGVLGVVIAALKPSVKCLMLDVNVRAVELANANAKRNQVHGRATAHFGDGIGDLARDVDYVITNPPFRAGKQVVLRFFEESYQALARGGSLFAVLRKQQGAGSYTKALADIFGDFCVLLRKKGYVVVEAVKTRGN